jgi:hypothetical protein
LGNYDFDVNRKRIKVSILNNLIVMLKATAESIKWSLEFSTGTATRVGKERMGF